MSIARRMQGRSERPIVWSRPFVTAVPNWHESETFMVAGGKQFRILGINDENDVEGLEELYERGMNGIFVVEPILHS
jgi:hypothetical protein